MVRGAPGGARHPASEPSGDSDAHRQPGRTSGAYRRVGRGRRRTRERRPVRGRIGLNYRDHAAEAGLELPEGLPPVFTKFRGSISGPVTDVRLPAGGHTDWEVELVAVMGADAHQVPADQAWEYVAGLSVGQDISERITQFQGPTPQFNLGKSLPGFAPVGPWLVTTDEFADPDDLELSCSVNGEEVQKSRTSELIFSVPLLVARLSALMPLFAGDVIFTGTPAGVGAGRTPQRWLAPGDVLVSEVEGIGQLRQTFVA